MGKVAVDVSVSSARPPAAQIRVPLAALTGAAVVLVPGAVLAGFAAAGAWRLGIAPTVIVLASLWLMHRKIASLAAAAHAAERALAASAAHGSEQRREVEDQVDFELGQHALDEPFGPGDCLVRKQSGFDARPVSRRRNREPLQQDARRQPGPIVRASLAGDHLH